MGHSWLSIAAPFPRLFSRANYSGMRKAPSHGAHVQRKGPESEKRRRRHTFLTKLVNCTPLLQVKLLRSFRKARSNASVDDRKFGSILAWSRRRMSIWEKAIAANKFREDLFYRLAVVVINLPACRER